LNIYLHVEVAVREIDSKLLLATLAAARGHQVIVSDLEPLEKGIIRGHLMPGIFHTKSISPGKLKIERHNKIINSGSKVTSMDEESGVADYDYDQMLKNRYSEKTIQQASAIFTWGEDDDESLKKNYQKYSAKIHKTGSPRVDLWKSIFLQYWGLPKNAPTKPFLLISSSMSVCDSVAFHERIKNHTEFGYFQRNPDYFKELFKVQANDYLKAFTFVEAIRYLSKHNNGFDIVLRPHPVESIECWKILLEGIPNVHINREGSITSWVKNSFAVMHNGCTTAVETLISKKPLITYVSPDLNYNNCLTNELGYIVRSKEDLLNRIKALFEKIKSNNQEDLSVQLPKKFSKKIYLDENELAAKKIIKIWESLDDQSLSRPNNWLTYKWRLQLMNFNGLVGRILKFFIKGKFEVKKENPKFPSIEINEIRKSVKTFQEVLGINKKLECRYLSKHSVLIKLK